MSAANNINETYKSSDSSLITLKELCEDLSVSVATGRNWIKLGKITPIKHIGSTAYFSSDYAESLKKDITTGKISALKSRRNKKYISGNNLYNSYVSCNCVGQVQVQKLISMISDNEIELTDDIVRLFVADCAVKLIFDVRYKKNGDVGLSDDGTHKENAHLLQKFIRKEISFGEVDVLIDELITDSKSALSFCDKYPELFETEYFYEKNEDVLGLLFISCSNMGKRKQKGAYYTSNEVVKKLTDRVFEGSNDRKTLLDPCCGTGNFLLQLPDYVQFEDIYSNDIDPVSVMVARLNMALKYKKDDVVALKEHITCGNFLYSSAKEYDIILGNPPWGYEFSLEERQELKRIFDSASGANIESYDVFIENGIRHLKKDGLLAFVLPEAVLHVKVHRGIRQFLLENSTPIFLEYLGDAFDKVQCPSIILCVRKTDAPFCTRGLVLKDRNREYVIETDRKVSKESFSFLSTDEEYELLEKMLKSPNVRFLKDNAEFALGIVTGNNSKYVSNEKRADNEPVLKGSDIKKFYYNEPESYIVFKPRSFQQVAPTKLYRAKEKLFYRFISNSLVFAYDDKKAVSLNSCNILIPHLEGLPIKYVLAVLNSSAAEFVYEKLFNSVKVLRSHIEGIPIPVADSDLMSRIVNLTDKLIAAEGADEGNQIFIELDELIFEAYGLNEQEKNLLLDKSFYPN